MLLLLLFPKVQLVCAAYLTGNGQRKNLPFGNLLYFSPIIYAQLRYAQLHNAGSRAYNQYVITCLYRACLNDKFSYI